MTEWMNHHKSKSHSGISWIRYIGHFSYMNFSSRNESDTWFIPVNHMSELLENKWFRWPIHSQIVHSRANWLYSFYSIELNFSRTNKYLIQSQIIHDQLNLSTQVNEKIGVIFFQKFRTKKTEGNKIIQIRLLFSKLYIIIIIQTYFDKWY